MSDDGVWVKVWPEYVGTPEATITAITGSGITHTYGDFVAFEFLTSGSLTCTEGLVPEALLVGGGGGGGSFYGGGGAAGFLPVTDAFFGLGTHTVSVGAGGLSLDYGTSASLAAQPGDPSYVAGYCAVGGGGGGGSAMPGYNGGSGGGSGSTLAGGTGLPSQSGFNGGRGDANIGGGGGGSSADGTDSVGTNSPGDGGAGASFFITGSEKIMGGGGGAGSRAGYTTGFGAGGVGGGGNGSAGSGVAGIAGTPNTGSGGGGSSYIGIGGDGGSGVIILKVKASNAANVDKSGWTEVTEAMLAAAAKKREVERKAQAKKAALLAKTEELSGATQTDIKETK